MLRPSTSSAAPTRSSPAPPPVKERRSVLTAAATLHSSSSSSSSSFSRAPSTASTSASASASFVGASSFASSSARLVAAALQEDPNIFNYDDAVQPSVNDADEHSLSHSHSRSHSSHSTTPAPSASSPTRQPPPPSRYVSSLVRAAREREQHREAVRVTARQAEIEREEQSGEFSGKEKFITSAYKQQLQQLSTNTNTSTTTTTTTASSSPASTQQQRVQQTGAASFAAPGSVAANHPAVNTAFAAVVDGAISATAAEMQPNSKRQRMEREQHQSELLDSTALTATAG